MPDLRVVTAAWLRLSLAWKILVVFVIVAVVGAVPEMLYITRDRSTSLFATPLDPDQIAEVDARLAAWGIAHLTTANGVTVDTGMRNDVLLRLSLAGLPHPHVATSGEALAKLGALTPDALLAAQTRTGLSGDLAVALRGIDGVTDASVVIAPASQAAFGDQDASQATASVRLSLRPGAVLSPDAVDGVRAFVANAVPGLSREHITLLDDRGFDLAAASSRHDDAETIRTALQSALDTAFGAGSTIVRVHASYDERMHALHETDRLGVNGPVIASQGSDERLSNAQKRYSKRESSQDHGSIVKEEQTIVPPGLESRLSIAILVDDARGIDPVKIRGLAAAAAGLDRAGGDTVLVEPVHFTRPTARLDPGPPVWLPNVVFVLPRVAGVIALCFGVRFLATRVRKFVRTVAERETARATQQAVSGFAPRQVHGALHGEPPHTAAAVISALPAATAAVVLDFYSAEERAAIIERMARPASAFMPAWETLIHGE